MKPNRPWQYLNTIYPTEAAARWAAFFDEARVPFRFEDRGPGVFWIWSEPSEGEMSISVYGLGECSEDTLLQGFRDGINFTIVGQPTVGGSQESPGYSVLCENSTVLGGGMFAICRRTGGLMLIPHAPYNYGYEQDEVMTHITGAYCEEAFGCLDDLSDINRHHLLASSVHLPRTCRHTIALSCDTIPPESSHLTGIVMTEPSLIARLWRTHEYRDEEASPGDADSRIPDLGSGVFSNASPLLIEGSTSVDLNQVHHDMIPGAISWADFPCLVSPWTNAWYHWSTDDGSAVVGCHVACASVGAAGITFGDLKSDWHERWHQLAEESDLFVNFIGRRFVDPEFFDHQDLGAVIGHYLRVHVICMYTMTGMIDEELNGKPRTPFFAQEVLFLLDDNGKATRPLYHAVNDRPFRLRSPKLRVESPFVKSYQEDIGCGDALQRLFTATSLASCKNVAFIDVEREGRPADAKIILGSGKPRREIPRITHKVLTIDGKVPTRERYAPSSGGEHGRTRLHVCRGHFKEYTEDRPMFGRYTGRFWVPQHARGLARNGAILKDYAVMSNSPGVGNERSA